MLFCEVCDHEGTEQLRYTKEIYVRKDGLKQMLAIKKIYMDYETAPVGVSHMPQFAWELVSDKKNVKQKSYKLQIAKDADFTDLIYNSGKTESEESAHVYAEGASLESGKRYFVRAKASDGQEETDWSETASFVTALAGKNGEWEEGAPAWKAPFVSAETDDSYKNVSKGTYVRGTFEIKKDIKEAYAFTTALGLYQFYLNGKKVGEDEMTPGWTSYRRHLLYQTYDVTEYLQKGINGAGAMLAPGWYKGVMGLTKARNNYGDQTAFTMELLIRYTDGTTESVYTDPSWKGCDSPVVFAEIYDGETYDAALEIPDWSKAETTKGDWKPVQLVFFDTQVMRAQYAAKVRVMDRIPAKRIFKTPAGDTVIDFAQNMAGRIEVTAAGKPGDVIELHCFEVLDKDGNVYLDNLRAAKATMKYTFAREETVTWHPTFTYMGFQYALIVSYPGEPKAENFTACTLHSNMASNGSLECSNPLLNQLHHNFLWGLKSNFLDVPTDCPQRDERMGWTGDAQVFSPTAMYLEDTYAFYAKYLYDMAKEQSVLGGKVPHVVPSCGVEDAACVWGDAACIIPWNLYLFYGDKSILEDQFVSMKSWVEYITKVDGDNHGWRSVFHFGDWLALDNPVQGAEQVMGATDEEFIANLYYAISAGIVAKAAGVLGYREEQEKYQKLSEEQFAVVQEEYYSATGRCCIKTQTALLLTLKYHLSKNEELTKRQLLKLFEQSNHKLKTGFVGTPLLNNVLTDNGMNDLAYELLLNEEFPGWLYEVKLGATTVWERWNSLLADGTISGISMNSMNHYAYGSIQEWMFRHVAGINTMESHPGVRTVQFAPTLNWDLRYAEAKYDSASGMYSIRWELSDKEHVTITMDVPFDCTAEAILPMVAKSEKEAVAEVLGSEENGRYLLEPGHYEVSYQLSGWKEKTAVCVE